MNNVAFRIFLWCLPVFLLGGLTWHYLTPSGQRTIHYKMGDVSPFVQRLLPDDRVSAVAKKNGDAYVTLLDEPVYFSVTPPPGGFDSVTVELAFDPGGTPAFELGGLKDISAQAFDFRPLSNGLLESLGWARHDLSNELAIFSRDPKSVRYQAFLENPPERSQVATYRADFPEPFRLPNYTSLGAIQKFDVTLRGPHELLTYVKNEDFFFRAMYTDINRTYGADDGFVRVYDEAGNLMTEYVLRDDGNMYANQVPSQKTDVELVGRDWPEGVYRIVLSGTSDIVWRTVETSQRYLVVKNSVFVGDDVGYLPTSRSTTLYTDADRVTFETQHREGLQTMSVGSRTLTVDEVGHKYAQVVTDPGVTEIRSPVGDIKITGEGKYAFSRESFFNPDPVPVTPFTDLETSEVNYILASLAPVQTVDGWRVAGATFDTKSLAVENGAYKFALSAPGIHDNLGQVSVHGITVTFNRTKTSPEEFLRRVKHLLKLLLP